MKATTQPKILICDDEIDILDLCHTILHARYNLVLVNQCKKIIDTISKFTPDIIFMDLWFSEERGEDVIALIKNYRQFNKLPIILFSARENLEELSKELGVSGYLNKPFTGKELHKKIEVTLNKFNYTAIDQYPEK